MTPKQRFLLRAEAESHVKIAHTEAFSTVLDFAMLELIDQMPRISTPLEGNTVAAIANTYRLEGAKMYRHHLETIADKPAPAKTPATKEIDYRTP